MKLYLVHCGFYDKDLSDGLYETHMNFMVAAASAVDARASVKKKEVFREKRMHVDGMQVIEAVDGFRVSLSYDESLSDQSLLETIRHRDLAGDGV